MNLKFVKYQGTGNDFIMIDGRAFSQEINKASIVWLCDRRFGIGADGIIVLKENETCDFEMDYYNADGSQSFCGNGSRCAQAFAKEIGMLNNSACTFLAIDGLHAGKRVGDLYATKMQNVNLVEQIGEDYFINTGSPHYIKFVENSESVDVFKEGRAIRYSSAYEKQGVNVNFVSIGKNGLAIRTYERGVEAETYSCGTGVTAAAIAYLYKTNEKVKELTLSTKGGDLTIALSILGEQSFEEIWLIGPALRSFQGEVNLFQ